MGDEVPFIPFCFPETPPDTLCRWSIMILFACFVCIFGTYFVHLIWIKMEGSSQPMTMIQVGCSAIAFCFMTSSVLWCIHVGSSIFCIFGWDIDEWIKIAVAGVFFNQFGLSLMYLLYVFRLSYPFKGSILETSKLLWITFFIGFLLILVSGMTCVFVLVVLPIGEWEEYSLRARFAYQIINLLFTIILLSVFVKKMLSLHDVDLLNQAIKVIICAAIGLLSSQLLDNVISNVRSFGEDSEILWMMHGMLFMLDQLINLICIYLQFPFGSKAFEKICGKLQKSFTGKIIKISGLKHIVKISDLKHVVELEAKASEEAANASNTSNTPNMTDKTSIDSIQTTTTSSEN